MIPIELPIIGNGSQPKEADGAELAFMNLPSAMSTYTMPSVSPVLAAQPLDAAKNLLKQLYQGLSDYRGQCVKLDLALLDQQNLEFINQVLGEGEVSIVCRQELSTQIQESVLAGIWRIQILNDSGKLLEDFIEVGEIPGLIKDTTFSHAARQIVKDMNDLPAGVMNAPPLIAELNAEIAQYRPDTLAHVINLSLLPQTEQDLQFLSECLGQGAVTILSRGYGTTRISSTATDKVWWVRYFNSDDTMILNTLEVSKVPAVACAAIEDIEDSAQRLQEILAVYS